MNTIYSCVVGSRAYGLDGLGSDTDRRGVYVTPTSHFWRLDKPPSHMDGPLPEQFSWEVERYCELALQSNPTVLECLWSPLVEVVTGTGRELVALRRAFLSRLLIRSYGDYARDQFKRLEATRARTGAIKWKQAMHMLRLLLAGAHALDTHDILVHIGAERERLLAVKRGEWAWDEVRTWASTLEAALARAADRTTLPESPDRAAVNDFLVRTRRAHLD